MECAVFPFFYAHELFRSSPSVSMPQRYLSFADQTVRLVYPDELQQIIEFLFADIPGRQGEPCSAELTVECDSGTCTSRIFSPVKEQPLEVETADLPYQLLIRTTTALVQDLNDGIVLHAGAVAREDAGIILPGMAGIGKTMLTAWLLVQGYQYLTDELVCVTAEEQRLLTLKRPLAIKKSAKGLLTRLFGGEAAGPQFLAGPTADLLPWQLLSAAAASASPVIPRLLLFPEFRPKAELSIEALTPAQAGLLAMASLVNARNLPHHGFSAVSRFCRSLPAIRLIYGDWEQLPGTLDRLIDLILSHNLQAAELLRLLTPINCSRYGDTLRSSVATTTEHEQSFPASGTVQPIAEPTPRGPAKKLTIGMATYDDYDGVYFSIQSIRLYHPEVVDEIEILVVDNHPDGPFGPPLKKFEESIAGYRYVPLPDMHGTAVRDMVFREAAGEFVLCIDCHVLIVPGALCRLLNYIKDHPGSVDLLQGPMLGDNLARISTHLETQWRAGMYGIWATDDRGVEMDGAVFDIPMQGLGLFCCRREVWPGFNPRFRGFGGEEGYIHEKFRANGGRTLCLPFLRWLHRFGRPLGVPYPINWEDRIHNYLIGFHEVGLSPESMVMHFQEYLGEEPTRRIVVEVEEEMRSPFFYFDAVYCIVTDTKSVRWAVMRKRLQALGLETAIRVLPAVMTPGNHHIGCALSHRSIISRARLQNLGNVLVFEDDAIFLDETLHFLQRSLNELKTQDWNVFYLGGHSWGRRFFPVEGCSFLERPVGLTCTHALAYNRSVFDFILAELPDTVEGMAGWIERNGAIDQFLPRLDKIFVAEPVVASQLSILPQEKEEFRHRFTLGALPSEGE